MQPFLVKVNVFVVIGIVAISAICLLNLNGLIYMWIGVGQVFSVLLLFVCIYTIICSRIITSFAKWYVLATLLFCMSALAFSLGSNAVDSRYLVGPIGSALIVVALSSGIASLPEASLRRIFTCLTWIFLLGILATILSPYLTVHFENPPPEVSRHSGLFANPNESAMVALAGYGHFLFLFFHRRNHLYLFFAALGALAILLTFSKTALLGLIATTALAVVFSGTGRSRSFNIISICGAVLAILVIFNLQSFEFTSVQERRISEMSSILGGEINSETTTNRTWVWAAAVDQIEENNLILGSGLGAMRAIEGGVLEGGEWKGAHNFWLMLIGEAGALALLGFLIFYSALLRRILRRGPYRLLLLSGVAVLVFDSLSSHNTFEQRHLAVIVGICVGLISVSREHRIFSARDPLKGLTQP